MTTPVVLMATDKAGWSFENIAKQIARRLSLYHRFKIIPFTIIRDGEQCDILVALWWQAALRSLGSTRAPRLITCLYDHLSWCIDEPSRVAFKTTMNRSNVLVCCNRQLLQEVKDRFPDDLPEQCMVLEDGVDTDLFREMPLPDKFCAGWAGNSSRHTPGGPEDHKGLELIKEAARIAEVDLHILDAAKGPSWPLAKMPEFYNRISCYLCASYTEGTPNPVLEAMSMGRPAVTTRVGLCPDIINHGKNGFLVDRTVEALASSLSYLKARSKGDMLEMSKAAHAAALKHSWSRKADGWREAFRLAQSSPSRHELTGGHPGRKRPNWTVPVEVQSFEPRTTREIPKVLLMSDVRDWAFHQNMRDLEEYNKHRFEFEHFFVADFVGGMAIPTFEAFDGVFSVYHRWPINHLILWDRTVGSLRALWFKPEEPRPPTQEDIALVNSYRGFHVVTQQNYDELKERCPRAVYLTNPVNMRRFDKETAVTGRLIASWNGNANHRNAAGLFVKGFYDIIQPATRAAGIELVFAEYGSKRLDPKDMPNFYLRGNVAICASAYEGASNSIMEAMACGQAVISTPAGNIVEIHDSQMKHYGESGIILVERDAPSITAALNQLRNDLPRVKAMGQLNREEIKLRWSWDAWADRYADFLRMCWS